MGDQHAGARTDAPDTPAVIAGLEAELVRLREEVARLRGLLIDCPTCAGERVVGGAIDGSSPAHDVRCPRCHGCGVIALGELAGAVSA